MSIPSARVIFTTLEIIKTLIEQWRRQRTLMTRFYSHYLRQLAQGKPKLKALVSITGKPAEIIYPYLKTKEPYQYQGKYSARLICHMAQQANRHYPIFLYS